MPRIFTAPDLEFDRSIPKVLIRNCHWTEEEIKAILLQLSDDVYDIYLYNDSNDDIQWMEGIRDMAVKTLDCNHYRGQDPVTWLRELDDLFKKK